MVMLELGNIIIIIQKQDKRKLVLFSLEFVDIDEFNNKVFDRGSRTLVDPPIPLEDLNFSQLIAMNDKYNILGYEDTALDRARRLLLNDVRKSKGGGYVPWTVETRMF